MLTEEIRTRIMLKRAMGEALKKQHAEAQTYFKTHVEPYKKKIVHVRDKRGRITATLIAVWHADDKCWVGWAKYNKHDVFNRMLGIVTAFQRAIHLEVAERVLKAGSKWTVGAEPIPKAVRSSLEEFIRRIKERAAQEK
jgi:hypothetical protein